MDQGFRVSSRLYRFLEEELADRAWERGDFAIALDRYLDRAAAGASDTVWYNVGTAALAVGDTGLAQQALERAARSGEAALRFRALYNLGLAHLRRADLDSAGAAEHLASARRAYREALLLRPFDADAKWNLELALRRTPPPPDAPPPSGSAPPPPSAPQPPSGLTQQQAEQLLNSIAEEERRGRLERNRRRSSTDVQGRKNW